MIMNDFRFECEYKDELNFEKNSLGFCKLVDVFLDCKGIYNNCVILKVKENLIHNNDLRNLVSEIKMLSEIALLLPNEDKNRYFNMILNKINEFEVELYGKS